MDCDRAGHAMMQYLEKNITHSDARDLAAHLMHCESCREYFTALDAAAEIETLTVAPTGLTEAVMLRVHEQSRRVNTVTRILCGLSAILLGVGLLLIFNPAMAMRFPIIMELQYALSTVSPWAVAISSAITTQLSAVPASVSFGSLMFMAIVGALFFVLSREESTGIKSA